MIKELERNYEELEGRIVFYHTGESDSRFIDGRRFYIGLVVGCNYDVGITIVNYYDHDEYIDCLLGPLAPNLHPQFKENFDYGVHDEMVAFRILAISEGSFDSSLDYKLYERLRLTTTIGASGTASAESCPFNQ